MKSTTMLAMRAEAYTATQGANPILAHYDLTKDGKYSCQTYIIKIPSRIVSLWGQGFHGFNNPCTSGIAD